jgi:hypothetical protein
VAAQDWILKCLQGERARPLAACEVTTFSTGAGNPNTAATVTTAQDLSCVLYDVLEVADCCGATGVTVTLDERCHGTQSLLQPNLGAFQGPALCIHLAGVTLTSEEISQLLGASAPFKIRGNVCRYGNGLINMFAVTDLPLLVSGERCDALCEPATPE